MYVIVRKNNEDIVIPTVYGLITVTLLESVSGKAKLGVNAPKEVRIVRGEQLQPSDLLVGEVSNVNNPLQPTG